MAETTDLQRLIVSLEANVKGFEKSLARANGVAADSTRKVQRDFDRMNSNVGAGFSTLTSRFALMLGGLAAGALSVQGALSAVGSAVTEFGKIGDLAERVNITTDALQALRFIVAQNGGEATDADNAIQKFSQSLGEAAQGSGDLLKILQANGVALRDKAGNLRSVDDMLGEFARLVAGASSQTERMAMVVDAFGRRAGPAMLVALQEIASSGLPNVVKAAQDVGVVADKELIQKAKEVEDAWDQMTTAMSVALRSRIISAIDDVQNAWNTFSKSVIEFYRRLPGGNQLLDLADRTGETPADAINRRFGGMAPPAPRPGSTIQPNKAPTSSGAGAGGGVDTKDPIERQIDSINKRISAMLAETATIGKAESAHEQLRVEMALLETARRGDTEVTDEQIARYATLRGQMSAEQALRAAGISLHEADAAAFQKISERMLMVARASEEAKRKFEGMTDALKFSGNTLVDVIDKMTQRGASFGEIMKAVLRDITREMLKAAITGEGVFAKLLGLAGTGGGVGGLLGVLKSVFGGGGVPGSAVSTGAPAAQMAAAAASTVAPAAPAAAMRGGNVSTMSVFIDAKGADRAGLARVERAVDELNRSFDRRVGGALHTRQVRKVRL